MTWLEARDVGVDRSGRRLLDGISLQIGGGHLVGIVGPTGAGKSTLLRVLSGEVVPSEGAALIDGVPVTDTSLADLARLRAYVGPPMRSHVGFRVVDVVAMGRHPFAADSSPANVVDDAMARTDIAHLARREVRTLSSGEQQRVNLARAIAQHTPVLLLDEPAAALDIGHQELVMKLLRDLAAAGAVVVAALHHLNLAAAYVDSILVLNKARAVATGTPQEVLNANLLSDVYARPIRVVDHPFRPCPLILVAD